MAPVNPLLLVLGVALGLTGYAIFIASLLRLYDGRRLGLSKHETIIGLLGAGTMIFGGIALVLASYQNQTFEVPAILLGAVAVGFLVVLVYRLVFGFRERHHP